MKFRNTLRVNLISPKWLLSAGVVLLILTKLVTFEINTIECVSPEGGCAPEIDSSLENLTNVNMFNYSNKINLALSGIPVIHNYEIRLLLNKIRVEVIQKKPMYKVRTEKNQYMLASDMTVIEIGDMSESNSLVIDLSLDIGSQVMGPLEQMIVTDYLIRGFSDVNNSIYKDGKLSITLDSGVTYLFPDNKDSDYLTGMFVLIYSQLNNDSGESRINNGDLPVKIVDMRFDNPVLKY